MAEQLITHAGHPLPDGPWCVNDACTAMYEAQAAIDRDDDPLDLFRPKEDR